MNLIPSIDVKPEDITEEVTDIQKKVCAYYKLKLDELTSPSRPNRIAHPRMLAMYLVRRMTELSLEEIGQRFGGRDHSTVIHACKRIKHTLEENPKLNDTIKSILAGEDPDQLKFKL